MSQESERTQRRQVGASLSWALAGQAARRGGNLLTSLILAQILLPSEIGTFTIPFTVAMFLLALNDLGIGYAVIRHRGDVNEVAPTAVTLAVTSSFTAWMGVIVFAPQIVDLFSSPQNPAPDNAVLFVRLLAVVIVFDGLTMVPGSALTRELREKDRTLCELGGFGATMTTSISVAVAGGGAWALVLGQIVGVTVTAALMIWRSPAKPRPGWDTKVAKGLVSFGLPLAGAGILNQAILNADYVIVNRYLGTDVAGAYFFAFNISNWPVTLVSLAMRRTAMASFSRLQHDLAALRRAFGNAVELLVTVTLPMAALIGTLAEEVITVLFPDEYLIGVIALRFLAAISVVRLLYQLCTDAIAALGRTTTILVVQGLWLGTLVPFMIIGASNWELTGLGVAQFASALGVALPILLWRLATLGFHIGPLAARLVRPLLGTAGLVATAFLVHELGGPAIVRLIVGGIAGLAVYAAIVLPRSDVLPQVLSLVGRGPLASTPAGAEPPAGAGGPVDGHLTDTSRPTVPTPDAAGSRTARRTATPTDDETTGSHDAGAADDGSPAPGAEAAEPDEAPGPDAVGAAEEPGTDDDAPDDGTPDGGEVAVLADEGTEPAEEPGTDVAEAAEEAGTDGEAVDVGEAAVLAAEDDTNAEDDAAEDALATDEVATPADDHVDEALGDGAPTDGPDDGDRAGDEAADDLGPADANDPDDGGDADAGPGTNGASGSATRRDRAPRES